MAGQLQYAGRATAWARTISAPLHEALAAAEASSARAGRWRRRTFRASLSLEAAAVLTEFWLPLLGSPHQPGLWNGVRSAFRGHGAAVADRRLLSIEGVTAAGFSASLDSAAYSAAWTDGRCPAHQLWSASAVAASLEHWARELQGARVAVRVGDGDIVFCLNTGTCGGGRRHLFPVLFRIARMSIACNVDLRAEGAAEGEEARPRVARAPYVFIYASTYTVDGGGRRAVAELFGAAGRPPPAGFLAEPAVFHTDDSEGPSDEVVRAVVGHHVWACPRLESAVVGAALSFGVDLLRWDVRSVYTVVVPVWRCRWWWSKYLADGPYTVLATIPAGTKCWRRPNTTAGGTYLCQFGHAFVVVRLAAPEAARRLGARPAA